MAKDYEKIYNEHMDFLKGKIDFIKISIDKDFRELQKAEENLFILFVNYRDKLKENKLNVRYPPYPARLRPHYPYIALAQNKGREMLDELHKYYEDKWNEFKSLIK